MNTLIFGIYRYFISPLVVIALPFAALFNRKLREGLRLRARHAEPLKSGVDPLWIHAASGEFEYAKAVIREIKERSPQTPVIVTYFSPSFVKAVTGFPGVDRAIALPLDLPGPCRSFIKQMHPRALLIARTDLWPEMLEQCRRANIPVVIFSYTQRPFKSLFKKIFTRWTLHWVDRVFCVAETDQNQLAMLALKQPVLTIGDTRYDQVAYRLANPKAIAPGLHPKTDVPCFVAGSTWTEDEAVLLPGLASHLKSGRLKLILVPHEPTPEHIRSLSAELNKLGLKYALFTSGHWEDEEVLLVDKIGVLAELYLWAEFAFVGGSFRKSVHSVMEALGAGSVTFVGPYYENNREAMQFQELDFSGIKGVEVIRNAKNLESRLGELLDTPEARAEFHQSLKREFAGRLGASRKLVDQLKDLTETVP